MMQLLHWSVILLLVGLFQWRTEHKCRPGRRPQMPPIQEKHFSPPEKNVNQFANISDDFFSFTQKNENYTFNQLCRPLRRPLCRPLCPPLLACAASNFHLFCPFFPIG